MSATILILNGPNLNLLGTREPEIYGRDSLADIEATCLQVAKTRGIIIDFRQSNAEGELVDWIQQARGKADAIIINAAAYTHTSVAIHDALKAFEGYKLELHISNPHRRETFRQTSYVSPAVDAVIAGLGTRGYPLALELVADQLKKST